MAVPQVSAICNTVMSSSMLSAAAIPSATNRWSSTTTTVIAVSSRGSPDGGAISGRGTGTGVLPAGSGRCDGLLSAGPPGPFVLVGHRRYSNVAMRERSSSRNACATIRAQLITAGYVNWEVPAWGRRTMVLPNGVANLRPAGDQPAMRSRAAEACGASSMSEWARSSTYASRPSGVIPYNLVVPITGGAVGVRQPTSVDNAQLATDRGWP